MKIMRRAEQEQIANLQQLMRIPSLSGMEEPIQQYICGEFGKAGIQNFRQGENVVAHLRGQDSQRLLIFNSHVDVVKPQDLSRWKFDPWSGEIKDGRIYGRGASDMKMGVAASMEVAHTLAERAKQGKLPYDVMLTYVTKEELDGSGTESFVEWFKNEGYMDKYSTIAAVFTEPSDLQLIENGHRGNYFIKASFEGDAGHSSKPKDIRRHAIVTMTDLIHDLEKETATWAERFNDSEFAPPTITATSFDARSGSPNAVAGEAIVDFDLRTIPGFHTEAYERVTEIAGARGVSLSLRYPDAPVGFTPPDAKIVQIFQEVVPDARLHVTEGSGDLGFMTKVGIEGVIFGPGDRSTMHAYNESAPLDHLGKAIDIYLAVYDKFTSI